MPSSLQFGERKKTMRVVGFVLAAAICFLAVYGLSLAIVSALDGQPHALTSWTDWMIFAGVTGLLIVFLANFFYVRISNFHVATLTNFFTGLSNRVLEQGWQFKWIWESVEFEIPLQPRTIELAEDHVTTQDGYEVVVRVEAMWEPPMERNQILNFRKRFPDVPGSSKGKEARLEAHLSQLDSLLKSLINGIATDLIRGKDFNEIWAMGGGRDNVQKRKIQRQELNDDLLNSIKDSPVAGQEKIEERFGINIILARFKDLDPVKELSEQLRVRAEVDIQKATEQQMVEFTRDHIKKLRRKDNESQGRDSEENLSQLTDAEAIQFLQTQRGKVKQTINRNVFDVGSDLKTVIDGLGKLLIERLTGGSSPKKSDKQEDKK